MLRINQHPGNGLVVLRNFSDDVLHHKLNFYSFLNSFIYYIVISVLHFSIFLDFGLDQLDLEYCCIDYYKLNFVAVFYGLIFFLGS